MEIFNLIRQKCLGTIALKLEIVLVLYGSKINKGKQMTYQQLVEHGYKYVWLQSKEGNTVGKLFKIAIVTDKLLEGYQYSNQQKGKDIAVFDQL